VLFSLLVYSTSLLFDAAPSEQKLDNISDRINGIGKLLQNLQFSQEPGISVSRVSSVEPFYNDISSSVTQPPCPFEGESSLTAQSRDASRFVEGMAMAVPGPPHVEVETKSLLASLRDVLRNRNDQMAVY
jgi:hypothetical protein